VEVGDEVGRASRCRVIRQILFGHTTVISVETTVKIRVGMDWAG
jgi:hypothetical protein